MKKNKGSGAVKPKKIPDFLNSKQIRFHKKPFIKKGFVGKDGRS